MEEQRMADKTFNGTMLKYLLEISANGNWET